MRKMFYSQITLKKLEGHIALSYLLLQATLWVLVYNPLLKG